MKISYISISKMEAEQKIEVKTHSLKTSSLFPQIDNVYSIWHDDLMRPIAYTRIVKQKNLRDEVVVSYNYNALQATMKRQQDKTSSQYPISSGSRDIFSLLSYIINGHASNGTYQVDANGSPWQANIKAGVTESVKTKIGKFKAKRYDLSFKSLSPKKTAYVDMVTFNLVNPDTKLSIWVSEDKLAVKALVRKKALSMSWELIALTP